MTAAVMGNTVEIELSGDIQAGKNDKRVWIAFLGNCHMAKEIATTINEALLSLLGGRCVGMGQVRLRPHD